MSTPDAFTKALKRLSMDELQTLFEVMAADRTPRQRLAAHLKLEWFRNLPITERSRAWLRLSRDGVVDIPPDYLPALDSPRPLPEAPLAETRRAAERRRVAKSPSLRSTPNSIITTDSGPELDCPKKTADLNSIVPKRRRT